MCQKKRNRVIVLGDAERIRETVKLLTARDSGGHLEIASLNQKEMRTIDRLKKNIVMKSGEVVTYHTLVIIPGTVSSSPNIAGVDKRGVFVYETDDDLRAIRTFALRCKRAFVHGSRPEALKAARACADLGLETILLQGRDNASSNLEPATDWGKISVRPPSGIKCLMGNGRVTGVRLIGDYRIPTDMVVVMAEQRNDVRLAEEAGVLVAENNHVLVDRAFKTSDPHIYALGPCVRCPDVPGASASIADAVSILARDLSGEVAPRSPSTPMNSRSVGPTGAERQVSCAG